MLSPTFLSPRMRFNLSQPPPPLPVFSAQPYKLPTLQKNSNLNQTNTNTKHFRCSSCGNQSSLYNISRFQGHPDSEPSSRQSLSQSLSPSLLALWLRSCRTVRDVKRLHSVVLKCLRDQDTYVFNNLVCAYIRFGKLSHARNVFDEMSLRNVVTWTAIINGYLSFGFDDEALSLFKDSVESGILPNAKMFVCLLNLCSKRKDFELGMQVHAAVAKGGLSNVIVESSVVKFYAQCGDLRSAFREFDRMPKKDVVCWTTMVTACAQQGRGSEAFALFARMLSEGFSPNEFTVCGTLKACGDEEALSLGQALHGAVAKKLYKSDVFVGTSLIDMYAKCGRISDARSVFDRMRRRNTATWTSIIAGYARRKGLGEEAVRLFRAMKRRKVSANNLTIVSVVRACGSIRALLAGREVHAQIVRNSIETSFHLGSTLVWFYCRCSEHAAAARVLQGMPLRDVVSWTALISGCASASASLGLESEALEHLREMVEDGVEPNAFTYSSALKACARLAAEAPGRLIHSSANKTTASRRNVFVGSALIHMYAKCGRVADASRVFDEMPERNLVAWKSMIVGYARNGLCREALKLVYRMRAEGFEVDDYVLSEVLNACGNDVELGVERPAECELLSG